MINTTIGQQTYAKAKRLIPGGTQLLSKRPEMFLPDLWPSYYQSAKGSQLTDLDGNIYTDMSYCGIGATILGYADDDVDGAVKAAIDQGQMTTLNCPEEVDLAELLVDLHPWADMVRFCRAGGEALSIAVRISRAHTGRDVVAFCGYHGWHDWYLAANLADDASLDGHLLPGLAPKGVPRGLKDTMQPFNYEDLDGLKEIASKYKDRLAAIVMEPVRGHTPAAGFLEGVRDVATETGAVLIFDEVTSGWRLNTGGVHMVYGVEPDLTVFAKGMGNGYPISAVVGREKVMQAAQTSFISSTAWTERVGSVAALTAIKKHRDEHVADHLIRIGTMVQQGWQNAADKCGLDIHISGIAPLGHLGFKMDTPQAAKTLFVQLMLERGYLATTSFYAMFAHTDDDVAGYLQNVNEVFADIAAAHANGGIEAQLKGPIAHDGFKRLVS